MKGKLLRLLITFLTIFAITGTSMALPEMLDSFNAKYNTTGTALDTCDLCHVSGQPQRFSCDEECHVPNKPQKIDPVNLNPYGKSFRDHENMPVDKAFKAIENIDSAGDKIPNIFKIRNLSFPGNKFGQKNKIQTNDSNNSNGIGSNGIGKNIISQLIDMLTNKK